MRDTAFPAAAARTTFSRVDPTAPDGCVVLACRDLTAAEAFFTGLGFRLRTVFPADAPRELGLDGFGLRLCLVRSERDGGGHLRLHTSPARTLTAPNGARIECTGDAHAAQSHGAPALPALPVRVAIHRATASEWHGGRAGMLYRDLLPGRLGGAVVASHIRIPRGGSVADYVHFHRVAAQALYVRAGEVRVVYEDQGEPFVLHAGDCVLQPPAIRHRVLDCSDGLEVIEIASPAEHVTVVADDPLPSPRHDPARRWNGQRFHHHRAERAPVAAAREPGWRARDCGIAEASNAAIGVRVLTCDPAAAPAANARGTELRLWFALRGSIAIAGEALAAGDLAVLPPHAEALLSAATPDVELLEFAFAAAPPR
jgi:quercetin dioxygenase-like cupin family protein